MRNLFIALALVLVACGPQHAPTTAKHSLRIGERLPRGMMLAESERPEAPRNIDERFGTTATVFYAWSVPCPCVDKAERRIQKLVERFGSGVAWIAIAGEPSDTVEQIHEKKLRLGSPYPILLDPEHKLCDLLRLDGACQLAVIDGAGQLVYGGSLDGDYREGKGEHLAEALTAMLQGVDVPVPYRERTYGCTFNDPSSCLQPSSRPIQ